MSYRALVQRAFETGLDVSQSCIQRSGFEVSGFRFRVQGSGFKFRV